MLFRDFWSRIADRGVPGLQLAKEFAAMASAITIIPATIYVGAFYVHLTILNRAGVHDALMTSAFQVRNNYVLLK